jgi:hypothetical protein
MHRLSRRGDLLKVDTTAVWGGPPQSHGQGVHDLRGVIAAAGHALHTKALGPEGEVTGELPEQDP